MDVNPDFKDLFSALNAARVRYLIIGGYAFAFHAHPRWTKDVDVWVDRTPANARRVLRALEAFGAPTARIAVEELTQPDMIFQIGNAPVRIDILTFMKGVTFAPAWERRKRSTYGGVRVNVVSVRDLIRNKKLVGRPQDLADVAALEAQHARKA